MKKKMKIKTKV